MLQQICSTEHLLCIGAENRNALFNRETNILSPTFKLQLNSKSDSQILVDEFLQNNHDYMDKSSSPLPKSTKEEFSSTNTITSEEFDIFLNSSVRSIISSASKFSENISNCNAQVIEILQFDRNEIDSMNVELNANNILKKVDIKDSTKVEKYLHDLSSTSESIRSIKNADEDILITKVNLISFNKKNIEIFGTITFLQNTSPII